MRRKFNTEIDKNTDRKIDERFVLPVGHRGVTFGLVIATELGEKKLRARLFQVTALTAFMLLKKEEQISFLLKTMKAVKAVTRLTGMP